MTADTPTPDANTDADEATDAELATDADAVTDAELSADAHESDEGEAQDDGEAQDEGEAQDDGEALEDEAPHEGEQLELLAPAEAASGEVARAHLKGLIEALVFAADHPMSINEIAKAAGKADKKLVRTLVDELRHDYAERGVLLEEVGAGLLFRTNPAFAPFVRDVAARKPIRMTRAQLETLAIIAYRQPITRPEVDDIRGVDSGPVLKMLLERDVVRILGKKDEPGRPLLYGTTPYFLEFFGLKNLKDLPTLREFTELSEDSKRLYEREASELEAEAEANSDGVAPAVAPEAYEDPPLEGGLERDTASEDAG